MSVSVNVIEKVPVDRTEQITFGFYLHQLLPRRRAKLRREKIEHWSANACQR